MKYYIQTLGCAMNYSDTERVSSMLEKLGYEKTETPEDADIYIFNTCSIRQKGEDRVYGQYQNVAGWKKSNPRLLIGITGCMVRNTSTKNTERENQDHLLKLLDQLDFVFRINDTHKLGEVLSEAEPRLEIPELEEGGLNDYLRVKPKYQVAHQAFVPIQIGCDKYCTYCIVPYARGREKSRPMQDIIAECTDLVEKGCKEITLVGQTVNSYGKSVLDEQDGQFAHLKDPFVSLLEELDKLTEKGLNRLRFTSPHPRDYNENLIEAHARLQCLTPHFHLPIQAGDDQMLQKMNRQYTFEKYKKLIDKIREILPEASVTTDIIVGFCGETDEQFENTVKAYNNVRWDMAYLARYSPRKGTVSWKAFKDDVSREKKAERWHKLNKLLEACSREYNESMTGKTLEVLVEKFDNETGLAEGKSRENKIVQFPGAPDLIGHVVNVKITNALTWTLKGEKIS
ncbi:tRNA (N6-isopentenyl adenosine(37)-C2)-methylthiotransferase MiaB [Candidatus Peregrinibacteria bacterium]|nr:tRNA (N6-isopentenyl adenosine(37)-C2)-methylthiotransferase MiaB [Candidatus Peregrinibacteria bacterium]